jgi:hypothetical protein
MVDPEIFCEMALCKSAFSLPSMTDGLSTLYQDFAGR